MSDGGEAPSRDREDDAPSEGHDEDPFADFEDYDDREGDPFASLDGPEAGADADSPGDRGADDPFDRRRDERADSAGPDGERRDAASYGADRRNADGERPDPGTGHEGAERPGQTDPDGGAGRDAEAGWDDEAGRDAEAGWDDRTDRGRSERAAESGGAGGAPDAETATAGPLGDVDTSRGDPFEAEGSAFEQVDVSGLDPDDAWNRFTGEAEPADADDGADAVAPEEDADDVVEVSKHGYCEGCEFFSPPPEVHCNHEGTSILEFTDMDRVRIANCPVVVERRELGEFDEE